ncbi:hypothetical protein C2G38_2237700 [Gigaspora rosea]|uniref:Uncharacterized protein n=1 Tax=Gigaspora rosea TaxID=44941 RepID=A0A397TY82_9GLOM|nr:hypothetical protein C2G38_2237700 [Gigaspora rosea]
MTRKDKKNRTCGCWGHTCAIPQKLQEHLKRKNPCRPHIFQKIRDEHFDICQKHHLFE